MVRCVFFQIRLFRLSLSDFSEKGGLHHDSQLWLNKIVLLLLISISICIYALWCILIRHSIGCKEKRLFWTSKQIASEMFSLIVSNSISNQIGQTFNLAIHTYSKSNLILYTFVENSTTESHISALLNAMLDRTSRDFDQEGQVKVF